MPEEIKTQDAEPEDQWLSDILQAIHRARRRSKGYASFFDWPDKPIKELGIVRDLLDSIETDGGNHGIVKLHHHRPDPPDCVGTSANGERTYTLRLAAAVTGLPVWNEGVYRVRTEAGRTIDVTATKRVRMKA